MVHLSRHWHRNLPEDTSESVLSNPFRSFFTWMIIIRTPENALFGWKVSEFCFRLVPIRFPTSMDPRIHNLSSSIRIIMSQNEGGNRPFLKPNGLKCSNLSGKVFFRPDKNRDRPFLRISGFVSARCDPSLRIRPDSIYHWPNVWLFCGKGCEITEIYQETSSILSHCS